jgi:hypothetical protein
VQAGTTSSPQSAQTVAAVHNRSSQPESTTRVHSRHALLCRSPLRFGLEVVMPHLDVKYRPDVVAEKDLESAADQLIEIVAKHFDERPEYVSLELVPQHSVSRNRKDVDLELNSSPDDRGQRSRVAGELSRALAETLTEHLTMHGYPGVEISAWIRVFDTGEYQYQRTADVSVVGA